MSRFNRKAKSHKGRRYINYYQCPDCNALWEDIWTSMCNDRCPECNKEIEPYASKDLPQPHGVTPLQAKNSKRRAEKRLVEASYRRKSSTGKVHTLFQNDKDVKLTTCGMYTFSRTYPLSRSYMKDWPLTEEKVTCKNCLRQLNPVLIPEPEIAHQVINKHGHPASIDVDDLCIFPTPKRAQEWIDYMQELGRDAGDFRIRKVKIIYLEE